MSKGLRIATVMIGCLMLSLGVHAEAPKYSFAQVSYAFIDIDEEDFDKGSGGAIMGSYGFDNFQVFGGWGTSSLDFIDGMDSYSVDVDDWMVGGGWHGALGEPADLVIDFGYLNTKLGGDIDTDVKNDLQGYFADIGFRWRIIKPFEIDAFYTYSDLDMPLGASNTYQLNALGYIGRVVVGVGYQNRSWNEEDLGDWNVGSVFVRYNFGKN
jgi:hypothetical protein